MLQVSQAWTTHYHTPLTHVYIVKLKMAVGSNLVCQIFRVKVNIWIVYTKASSYKMQSMGSVLCFSASAQPDFTIDIKGRICETIEEQWYCSWKKAGAN